MIIQQTLLVAISSAPLYAAFTVIFALSFCHNVYFAICVSKTLQKSYAIQKISVTLSSVITA